MRAQLGKFALAKMRKPLKKLFAGNQRQHGVAQKLQLFVIADLVFALTGLLRFLLARLRTVGESLLHHRPAVKVVVQSRFQRGDLPFFHVGPMQEPRSANNHGRAGNPISAPDSVPAPCHC